MLTFDQIKAIEKALGPEAAAPVIEAFQSSDQRVMTSLLAEVATKADLERLSGSATAEIEKLRGDMNARLARLEVMVKVLIGLAVVAIAMFSPAAAELVKLLK